MITNPSLKRNFQKKSIIYSKISKIGAASKPKNAKDVQIVISSKRI